MPSRWTCIRLLTCSCGALHRRAESASKLTRRVNVTQEHNNPSRDGVYVDAAFTPSAAAVTQEHNNPSRDGVYVDAAFTPSAAANLTRDLNFNGTISGNVYAQPLYIEGGPNGPVIIAVTESNNVYALNATTGTVIWQRNLGTPVPLSCLGCGKHRSGWDYQHARRRPRVARAVS